MEVKDPSPTAPTLFPDITEKPKRPRRRETALDGPDNLRRYWNTRDDRGLTYTQSRKLGEYFIEALSKMVHRKKWDKCLEEARKQVIEFYPKETSAFGPGAVPEPPLENKTEQVIPPE